MGCACRFVVQTIGGGEVAHIEPVNGGQIHLGILDIEVALEFAGIFHSHYGVIFGKVIFAEDIQAEFLEIPVESRGDLAYLAFDDASKGEGERPVFIFEMADIPSVLKTVSVTAAGNLRHFFTVAL